MAEEMPNRQDWSAFIELLEEEIRNSGQPSVKRVVLEEFAEKVKERL